MFAIFSVDVLQVGYDDVTAYALHDGTNFDCQFAPAGVAKHRVSFVPQTGGIYKVMVFCGGLEVPGKRRHGNADDRFIRKGFVRGIICLKRFIFA